MCSANRFRIRSLRTKPLSPLRALQTSFGPLSPTFSQRPTFVECSFFRSPPYAPMLQFVDHSAIDQKARKAIRSHCMKGKNAGKTITRRSRATSIRKGKQKAPGKAAAISERLEVCSALRNIQRFIDHEFSTLPFSAELSPDTRNVIRQCQHCPRVELSRAYYKQFSLLSAMPSILTSTAIPSITSIACGCNG